jgi:hypothetical protein
VWTLHYEVEEFIVKDDSWIYRHLSFGECAGRRFLGFTFLTLGLLVIKHVSTWIGEGGGVLFVWLAFMEMTSPPYLRTMMKLNPKQKGDCYESHETIS